MTGMMRKQFKPLSTLCLLLYSFSWTCSVYSLIKPSCCRNQTVNQGERIIQLTAPEANWRQVGREKSQLWFYLRSWCNKHRSERSAMKHGFKIVSFSTKCAILKTITHIKRIQGCYPMICGAERKSEGWWGRILGCMSPERGHGGIQTQPIQKKRQKKGQKYLI